MLPYCFVCGQCLYTPQEQAAERLCWPCAVVWDGGVRLRSSVVFPEVPEPREAIVLMVGGIGEAMETLRNWRPTGQNVPEKILNE